MHEVFVHMVKVKLLAQFSGNHLAHPFIPRLIHFLPLFAAFEYYVINGFVSVTTLSTSAVLFRLVYF